MCEPSSTNTYHSIARVHKGNLYGLHGVLCTHIKGKCMPELELNIMKNITIKEAAKIDAKGNLNSKRCKPVICIDTGEVYTSATDASNANGTTVGSISTVCLGKTKTANGKRFCYVQDFPEHLADITARISSMNKGYEEMASKAAAYDAILAEQKAKAKAEEDARKAKEKAEIDRQKAITKATERLERKRALYERKHRELDEVYQSVLVAERELANLTETKKRPMVPYEIIPRGDQFELIINGIERGLYDSEETAELIVNWYIKHEMKA